MARRFGVSGDEALREGEGFDETPVGFAQLIEVDVRYELRLNQGACPFVDSQMFQGNNRSPHPVGAFTIDHGDHGRIDLMTFAIAADSIRQLFPSHSVDPIQMWLGISRQNLQCKRVGLGLFLVVDDAFNVVIADRLTWFDVPLEQVSQFMGQMEGELGRSIVLLG